MRSNTIRHAVAVIITAAIPMPSQALELTGKLTCIWKTDAAHQCTGTECRRAYPGGERPFQIDLDARIMCGAFDPTCTDPVRFGIVERETPVKTAILIVHTPDSAMTIRIAETGKLLAAVMQGIDRVLVMEGACEKR